jgi:hypothetical protein
MEFLRSYGVCALLVTVNLAAADAVAQAVPVDDIQKQLLQLYQVAKATADGTDIVTAGSVLVLQKDHLQMSAVDQPTATPNVYKNGAITQSGLIAAASFFKSLNKLGPLNPAGGIGAAGTAAANAPAREFVAGEKFWVTRIDTRPDGVTFYLLSDPIKDVRYHSTLKFPFAKGTAPGADDVAGLTAEVLKIDAPDPAPDQAAATPAAAAPPVETKTIAIGQTRDQVIAMFGVPSKVVQLGPKEIDFFPDMKVTFVQGKVADVK